MAIQVSGTEVISNSRVLSNVTGLKTVGGTAILGSGDIAVGGSTTYGAVGTYGFLFNNSGSNKNPGETVGGGNLPWTNGTGSTSGVLSEPSGTWQCMGHCKTSTGEAATLWIRTA